MASNSRLVVLKKSADFDKIFTEGQRVHASSWLLLSFVKNDIGIIRCGWTISRKVGNAVLRNRLRRWSREFFRKSLSINAEEPKQGIDVNLVFRKTDSDFYKKLNYEQFARVMEKGWKQLQKRI